MPNASPCRSSGVVCRISDAALVEISAPVAAWATRATSQELERRAERRERGGDGEPEDADDECPAMAVSVADRAAERQRDATAPRYSVTSDATALASEAELAHDAGQRDREHRRVERDEDRAARDPEHRRRQQATVGRVSPGLRHRSRTVPAVPSISTVRPSRDARRRAGDADDRRQAELAGHDGGVREDAAGVRDEAAGDREDRHPRRVRGRADDDVAGLDAPEVVRAECDARRPAHDPGRGARAA